MLSNEVITQFLRSVKEVHGNSTEGVIVLHDITRVGIELKTVGGDEAEIMYEIMDC